MKKLVIFLVGLFGLVSVSGYVLAKNSYKYAIRIKNSTKYTIKVEHAKYQIKGSAKEACRGMNGKKIKSKRSERCAITNALGQTKKHKWIVKYKCNGKTYRKSSGWFTASSTHQDATTIFGISSCNGTKFYGP
ncbi:MAG: hypothetical protein EP343_24645 [Deltaproteobacteria bacterium]|nr:MAG: hypothetical protein EP343_24645 [Deltaproteobacteria bacterium]